MTDMQPRAIFKYSWIYDQTWKDFYRAKAQGSDYPSPDYVHKYLKEKMSLLDSYSNRIFLYITKATSLEWKEAVIYSYFVGKCTPLSDPLTLMPFENDKLLISTLTHELIHQILIQNQDRLLDARKHIETKYVNESIKTLNHIIVYAIQQKLFLELSGKDQNLDIVQRNNNKEYVRALEIVESEGYGKIISSFTGLIR